MVPIGEWAKRERLSLDEVVPSEAATGSGARVHRAAWNKREMVYPSNVLHFAVETRNFGHRCAFPERLPDFFIRLLTKEGDLVLDPFLGSGTSAVVAKRLRRRFIGFEQDRKYVAVARRRVRAVATTARDAQ